MESSFISRHLFCQTRVVWGHNVAAVPWLSTYKTAAVSGLHVDTERRHFTSATFWWLPPQLLCLPPLFTWVLRFVGLEVVKIHLFHTWSCSRCRNLQHRPLTRRSLLLNSPQKKYFLSSSLHLFMVKQWPQLYFFHSVGTATVTEHRLKGFCLLLYATVHVKSSLKLSLKGCDSDYLTMTTENEVGKRVVHKQHKHFSAFRQRILTWFLLHLLIRSRDY